MDSTALEKTLRNLPEIGTLVKGREYRQVWRFPHDGKNFYLKFYPKGRLPRPIPPILPRQPRSLGIHPPAMAAESRHPRAARRRRDDGFQDQWSDR